MKLIALVIFLTTAHCIYSQSYVDSGIQHFAKEEYEEAMVDFNNAIDIQDMLTESSKAKIYYYRGMIWLKRAEDSKGNYAEENPVHQAHEDLIKATELDNSWEPHVKDAFVKLNRFLLDEAENYLKLEKKADGIDERTSLLDKRIQYLERAKELEVSSMIDLYLGQTNKQAGDIIFDNTTNVTVMQRAKAYYEAALIHYEIARYDDPFSKDIIEALLTISKRLGDVDRIAEYEKLLELAGG
ncbi:hypothetical protein SAMN05421640_1408 [Ekhidna lutea]|uniref:Tetratricopeptide repeat-containing protein n=2 Tax=Ekhidna lutea TaxID=447679 RepID=A0A239HPA3_EKHLU|nr:hypothetical protein SAMN05421640_1408 [Ekhidna lutea]